MATRQDILNIKSKLYENDAEEVSDAKKYEDLAKRLEDVGEPYSAGILRDIAKDERKHSAWLHKVQEMLARRLGDMPMGKG